MNGANNINLLNGGNGVSDRVDVLLDMLEHVIRHITKNWASSSSSSSSSSSVNSGAGNSGTGGDDLQNQVHDSDVQ